MDDLVRRGDPAELLREVERLCDEADWDGLVRLRDRCESATEAFGKQLWPVARYIEYRLALESPGPFAAAVCQSSSARFTLGPLTEVAAADHTWEELADHLPSRWAAASVAQERVIRGEDLDGDERANPEELELPLWIEEWEPDYPLPVYRTHEILEGGPPPVEVSYAPAAVPGAATGARSDLERGLAEVGATWAEESNGGCRVVSVHGDARDAAVALMPDVRVGEIPAQAALARIAWAAASGGAYGRRRGMAAGRSSAHWVCHLAAGLDYPADPSSLGEAVKRLRWYLIEGGAEAWSIRLAIEDPEAGWAAAIDAWDAKIEVDDDAPEADAAADEVTTWLLGRSAGDGQPEAGEADD